MFFWPQPHQMHRTAKEEDTNKASLMLAIMPYPTRARLDQAFRGVPEERKSAETLEEHLGSGEQSAAARTQTARPWWSRMFGG